MFATVPSQGIQPRPFTVDEYYRMGKAGIFHPDERVELIDGLIIRMPPQGPLHAATVSRIVAYLLSCCPAQGAEVRDDKPIALGEQSEPVPDVTVVAPDPEGDYYSAHHPGPGDVLLVIEVADSSLDKDLGIKRAAYARAGIREYWVVDVEIRRLHRFSDPQDGLYCNAVVLGESDFLSPDAFPALSISVADLLAKRR
ncbi:Uma2 family endonuclease [Gloeobacter morelensis]|uniref:Uma2 family endonuclease n=1 Tax=Gloeobacter morelensis TaxID=2907343 RepID=UPI001E4422EE|nr:Uma2 family endonuclease [Gloeobacter morelensis]